VNRNMAPSFCCICSNYRGNVQDDIRISLHRFPANKTLKRVWLQRARLVRKNLLCTDNSFMCSVHFVGMRGPTKEHTLPSVFPNKVFKTSVSTIFTS
jgi:hypothetical protein